MLLALIAAALGIAPSAAPASPPSWDRVPMAAGKAAPDLTLTGTVDRHDYQHSLARSFRVPADVERIGVELDYSRPDNRTVINLGLFDGERFRGWSGSNKHAVVIDAVSATPSYLPGPVGGRTWALDLGVSYIGEAVTSRYTAKIWFWRRGDRPAVSTFSAAPLAQGARWYRGDLHLHTGDSDGFCTSREGRSVPCPMFRTLDAAETARLDFVAITDHNGIAHFDEMRRLQPYYDDLLLIPGREMTTAEGHANIFGTTDFVEYRLGTKSAPDMAAMLRAAHDAGALISINHPSLPSDARCRGCGWTAADEATAQADAMEAVNGGTLLASAGKGDPGDIARWEAELAKGRRPTAIGGSDDHDVDLGRLGVGSPTTVVYAENLSERAILAGIHSGHVWIDLTGKPGRRFDLQAQAGGRTGMIGDSFAVAAETPLTMTMRIGGSPGAALVGIVDGKPDATLSRDRLASGDETVDLRWTGDGRPHWIRFEVRDGERPAILTNPIYVEATTGQARRVAAP